jgi:hypothetical protein
MRIENEKLKNEIINEIISAKNISIKCGVMSCNNEISMASVFNIKRKRNGGMKAENVVMAVMQPAG